MSQILIVDDEKEIRSSSAELLRGEGYIVDTSADGTEALAKANEKAYKLAFIDLVLPGAFNGFDTIAKLRELLNESHIVAFTGFNGQHLRKKAMAAGADDFMSKPILASKLLEKVYDIIGEKTGDNGKKTNQSPAPVAPNAFANMPVEKIKSIYSKAIKKELSPGEYLRLDDAKQMAVVHTGGLQMLFGPAVIGHLGKGQSLGESCVLQQQSRKMKFHLEATEPTMVFVFERNDLVEFLKQNKELKAIYFYNVAKSMTRKFSDSCTSIIEMLDSNLSNFN